MRYAGVLARQPWTEPTLMQWKFRVLTTGPQGMSQSLSICQNSVTHKYPGKVSSWKREHPVWRPWTGRVLCMLRHIKKASRPACLEQWFSSSGKFLELKIIGLYLRPTGSETLGPGPGYLFSKSGSATRIQNEHSYQVGRWLGWRKFGDKGCHSKGRVREDE